MPKEYKLDQEGRVSQCAICDRFLGEESRENGFVTCSDHRTCSKCGKLCQAAEIKFCVNNDYLVTHGLCLSMNTPKESVSIELANLYTKIIRPDPLMTIKDMELIGTQYATMQFHNQSFEQARITMKILRIVATHMSYLLDKEKKIEIEPSILESKSKKKERDKQEKIVKTRSQENGNEVKVDKRKKDPYEKKIEDLMKKAYMSREQAIQVLESHGQQRQI